MQNFNGRVLIYWHRFSTWWFRDPCFICTVFPLGSASIFSTFSWEVEEEEIKDTKLPWPRTDTHPLLFTHLGENYSQGSTWKSSWGLSRLLRMGTLFPETTVNNGKEAYIYLMVSLLSVTFPLTMPPYRWWSCKTRTSLTQSRARTDKVWLMGQIQPTTCLQILVLKHSHANLFTYCLWLLLHCTPELSSCDRDWMVQKA